MQEFYIIDEKRYPLQFALALKEDLLPFYRWEHRVTIGYRSQTFMVFLDNLKNVIYIEEMGTRLKEIEDESLWESLHHWVEEKGFLEMKPPLPKIAGQRFL